MTPHISCRRWGDILGLFFFPLHGFMFRNVFILIAWIFWKAEVWNISSFNASCKSGVIWIRCYLLPPISADSSFTLSWNHDPTFKKIMTHQRQLVVNILVWIFFNTQVWIPWLFMVINLICKEKDVFIIDAICIANMHLCNILDFIIAYYGYKHINRLRKIDAFSHWFISSGHIMDYWVKVIPWWRKTQK